MIFKKYGMLQSLCRTRCLSFVRWDTDGIVIDGYINFCQLFRFNMKNFYSPTRSMWAPRESVNRRKELSSILVFIDRSPLLQPQVFIKMHPDTLEIDNWSGSLKIDEFQLNLSSDSDRSRCKWQEAKELSNPTSIDWLLREQRDKRYQRGV